MKYITDTIEDWSFAVLAASVSAAAVIGVLWLAKVALFS